MNRWVLKSFVVVALFANLPVHAGETLDRVMRKQMLVEVTDQAYPPFSQVNEKGEVVGFDIDVAREIAKRLNVDLQVQTPTWEIISAGRWQGRYDICVCSMTPTEERREVLDFIAEYYDAPVVIVTNGDNVDIRSGADLEGRRVGVEAGTTYEKYLNKAYNPGDGKQIVPPFQTVKVKPYESEVMAFQDLALGSGKRLDAIVANFLTAREQVKKSDGKFKIVGDPLYAESLWISADKGDAEWNAKIKDIVAAMIKDGTLKALSEKWIGVDVSTKSPS